MSESDLWRYIKTNLGPYGRLKRIENKIEEGTPDVAYTLRKVSGWIELKYLRRWPMRANTPVSIPHLTIHQVLWLEAEARVGGRARCILQAGEHYLLLDSSAVRAIYERAMAAKELREYARVFWTGPIPLREVIKDLTW